MAHTPAPWKVKGQSPSLKITSNGFTVATIIATSKADAETKEANARLIAAAPELLEALKAVMKEFVGDRTADNCEGGEIADRARAAIAKAERQK